MNAVAIFAFQTLGEAILLSIALTALTKFGFSIFDSLNPRIIGKLALIPEIKPVYLNVFLLYLMYASELGLEGKQYSLINSFIRQIFFQNEFALQSFKTFLYVGQVCFFSKVVISILERFLKKSVLSPFPRLVNVLMGISFLAGIINVFLSFRAMPVMFFLNELAVFLFVGYIFRNWKNIKELNFHVYFGATLVIASFYYVTMLLAILLADPFATVLPYYVTSLTGVLLLVIADNDLGKARIEKWM